MTLKSARRRNWWRGVNPTRLAGARQRGVCARCLKTPVPAEAVVCFECIERARKARTK